MYLSKVILSFGAIFLFKSILGFYKEGIKELFLDCVWGFFGGGELITVTIVHHRIPIISRIRLVILPFIRYKF